MSSTPPGDTGSQTDTEPPYDGPRVNVDDVKDLGRIRRTADRKVGGVAGGIARHLDVDPVVVRVAFVVTALFGGGGILLYAAGWLFLPDERSNQAAINLDARSRTIVLAIVAALAALSVVGDSLGGFGFPWPLLVVGACIAVWMTLKNRDKSCEGSEEDCEDEGEDDDGTSTTWSTATSDEYAGYRPPPPVDPRKRGPVLFGFAMGLAAVAAAVIASLQLAGVDITAAAYPAAVVAACGVMLVVGAFYGRAGGLIPVGLAGTLVTVLFSLGAQLPTDGVFMGQQHRTPTDWSQLDESYTVAMGELKIDLTELDPEATDDQDLDVNVIMGHTQIIVPEEGLTVEGEADVGLGEVKAFGERSTSGSLPIKYGGGEDAPVLTIDAASTMGSIEIYVEGDRQ